MRKTEESILNRNITEIKSMEPHVSRMGRTCLREAGGQQRWITQGAGGQPKEVRLDSVC
jgi:hypothetical protein